MTIIVISDGTFDFAITLFKMLGVSRDAEITIKLRVSTAFQRYMGLLGFIKCRGLKFQTHELDISRCKINVYHRTPIN